MSRVSIGKKVVFQNNFINGTLKDRTSAALEVFQQKYSLEYCVKIGDAWVTVREGAHGFEYNSNTEMRRP